MSRILVIDDDPDISKGIEVVLASQSHKVDSAQTAEDGVKKIGQNPPDLIILDIMMARMGEGFDVCREIKGNPEWKGIPIILLTALKEKTGFDFSAEAGDPAWCPANAYLEKPVQPDKLIGLVNDLLKSPNLKVGGGE